MQKVIFYPEDEFPISYNLDKDKKISCIGMCMQCPAYKGTSFNGTTYSCDKVLKSYAKIYKILKKYDLEDFAYDDKDVVVGTLEDYLWDIGDETCSQDVAIIESCNLAIKELNEL